MCTWDKVVGPPRTMWQAAKDLIEEGVRERDPAKWEQGYKLWIQAAASRAKGEPFEMRPYIAQYLPVVPGAQERVDAHLAARQ